jgi:hypothetical protein
LTEEIKAIPDLPAGLREAAARGTLIPFVGAGASRIAGCPTWSEFADGALKSFVALGKFSHAQLDQIQHLNPRIKMSIALSLQKENSVEIDFEKLLYPSGVRDGIKGQRLYTALSRFGKTFVTTNYDEWLDKAIDAPTPTITSTPDPSTTTQPSRTVVYKVDELVFDNLMRPDTVIHLHGSMRDPRGMILTTPQYLKHYANDRLAGDVSKENKVLTFLELLFEHRTVLFVGYGLEELEILEYIIVKSRPLGEIDRHTEIRHYMLQGFFLHQHQLMLHLAAYYRDFGIQLIPFLRDNKDWDQLIDVLDDFARRAPAADLMRLQKLADMEGLLDG